MSYIPQETPNKDLTQFVDTVYRGGHNDKPHPLLFLAGQSIRSNQFGVIASIMGQIITLVERIQVELPVNARESLTAQLMALHRECEYVISAKNSETLSSDGKNAVSSLRDQIGRNRTEHIYSTDEERAKSFLDKLRGDRDREVREGRY
ncbi:MAG: hypothetical protein F4Y18_01970 [Cenarchaeum sp. SB0663_bin_5]|nr:hypothetical protein [Cenarchaeum sp. SB0663_bin_5]MYL10989.1 hypothetical protein [Cenarchaeum sp. SB0669_bin_11]